MGSLKAHSELAQEASDARLMHTSLLCLQKIRNAFVELSNLTNAGRLQEAVSKGQEVDEIVKEMPGYLQQTHAANDLKVRLYVSMHSFSPILTLFIAKIYSNKNPCSRPAW